MSHYEQRLETDLNTIQAAAADIAGKVEEALKDAVHALLTGNRKLAYATVLGDGPINRAVRELDSKCHGFIALHLPSAGHLRRISSTIRYGIILERIGDYAVTICREAVQLSKPVDDSTAREVELMADEARQMFSQATRAFNEDNVELARGTMGMADQVDRTFNSIFSGLITHEQDNIKDLFALLSIFSHIERVSDQSKNICEETVFSVTGEGKAKKVYRILFLDEENNCLGPLAQAIANKSFPDQGVYESAGRTAADSIYPSLNEFLDQRGAALEGYKPRRLEMSESELGSFHVIVSLQGSVESHIGSVPFHTAALEWDLGIPPCTGNPDEDLPRLEELYRDIAVQVRDLMHLLRGEES